MKKITGKPAKPDLPENCYNYKDLREILKMNHREMMSVVKHHQCPIAGQYLYRGRHDRKYNYYNINDIRKFMKTGKRVAVNHKDTVLSEWEVPYHTDAEKLTCRRVNQFYKTMAAVG